MTIKLYWCRGVGRDDESMQNFGDYLSPIIVELISGRKVVYSPAKKADLIAIGSVLPRVEKAKGFLGAFPRKIHVWGAGVNTRGVKLSPKHYYHAVRGKESLKQISRTENQTKIGDPGLLVNLMANKCKPSSLRTLGIVPHYVDQNNKLIPHLLKNQSSKFINVYDSPEKVISEIRGCDYILSSSMHGLIMADAFGIPNSRLVFRKDDLNSYKFEDYYSIYDNVNPFTLIAEDQSIPELENIDYDVVFQDFKRPGLDSIRQGLIDSFPQL